MPELPIRRIVMYKHGVGYFERRGAVAGTSLRLSFPREAMDDVLKSLIAIDLGAGQVRGIDFETPEDRAARLAKGSIHLSDSRSLLDLLRDLRGRRVRLVTVEETLEGIVVGVDLEEERPLRAPVVSLYLPEQRTIRTAAVRAITSLDILDDRASEDLTYFLRASQSEEDRRAATLRLTEGEHDLLVGYVAPSPAWRVSYRILFEEQEGETSQAESSAPLTPHSSVLLQGWGLFDNQLDEDLEDVTLTLVAGMPVSFRYRLYEPHTPERPLVADEERTVVAPVEFAGMAAAAAPMAPPMAMPAPAPQMARKRLRGIDLSAEESARDSFSMDAVEQSTVPVSAGEERGALFQYRVAHPVSVARGQSAMVPIVGQRLKGRKDLLYNPSKLAKHPVASLRMHNETGLTLERGPVTVIEEGDYAGEAVLPFTRTGAELIVPYAVELGISITEEYTSDRQINSIGVREDYLLIQEWDTQQALYRIKSTLAKNVDVVIEQAVATGYQLYDTPKPAEESQGLARWAVACEAGKETTFPVKYRRMVSRRERVRGVGLNQLRDYLRLRFLDEATFKGLENVLGIYQQIATHQQRIQQIEQERQRIYKRQQQTQGSLGPLGREGEEGKLRSRYVALLDELENQLTGLNQEEQQLNTEIGRLEGEASRAIAALSKA